jgi:hypothetical protein
MWFRNRLVYPVVRVLLHPLRSGSLAILSYQDRRSGCWPSLPCMYARDGQDLSIVPGQPGRTTWWCNLRQPSRSGCHCKAATRWAPPPRAAIPRPSPPACAATPRQPSRSGFGWSQRHGHGQPPTGRTPSSLTAASTGRTAREGPAVPRVSSVGGPTTLIALCQLGDARGAETGGA